MLVLVCWAFGSKLIADFPKGNSVLSIKRKKTDIKCHSNWCCLFQINLPLFPSPSTASSFLTPSPAVYWDCLQARAEQTCQRHECSWDFPLCQKLPSCRWEKHTGNDVMAATLIPFKAFEAIFPREKKETNANHMTREAEDLNREAELAPKAVCRTCSSVLLPFLLDTLWMGSRGGWSLDATCPIPLIHLSVEGTSSSCHPVLLSARVELISSQYPLLSCLLESEWEWCW